MNVAEIHTGLNVRAQAGLQDKVWSSLRLEAASAAASEPMLASYLNAAILRHDSFSAALAHRIADKTADPRLDMLQMHDVARGALDGEAGLADQAAADILAVEERDPACRSPLQPFLYFKGFHALMCYRIAHWLWREGRETLAFHLQSRVSERFGVDIHPAARLGCGIMIDHATAVTVGETAVVGDDVSILHEVTLGGTGTGHGDRHPKIARGVLIGAGAKVLGNITVGEEARIAAGSVVLNSVPAHCTVAGVPAKPVGGPCAEPSRTMDQTLPEGQ